MFCSSCGLNVKNDVIFCPNCGNSIKNETIISDIQQKENVSNANQTVVYAQNIYSGINNTIKKKNFPLLNLSGKLFYPFFEVCLWLMLIIGSITGGIIGAYSNENIPELSAILGVFLGLIIAFIINIILGGLVSIFLKINDNIEEINRKN